MAYTSINFPSLKKLKEAVKSGEKVTIYSNGPFPPKENGVEFVEGPHYPKPHSWYAKVKVENGVIVKVF